MTVIPDWQKWDLSQSHEGRSRVDVYSRGELVQDWAEIVDGTVTEKLRLGLRGSLTLDVEPSADWLSWMKLPLLEVKVWSAISWGLSDWWVPMGVFAIDRPKRVLPLAVLNLAGADRWKRAIDGNDLLYRWPGPAGWSTALAARLMEEGGLGAVSVEVQRDLLSPEIRWEGKRHDLISGYLLPAGNTAYVDRQGQAVIRTNQPTTGRALNHGVNGTLISIAEEPSTEGVYNAVGADSTNSSVVLDEPAFVMITDPFHPAHEGNIGRKQTLVSSNQIQNWGDAYNFARSELERLSSMALGWTAECVPDPTRTVGQLTEVTCEWGTITAITQQVTTPLVVDSDDKKQQIVLGATMDAA